MISCFSDPACFCIDDLIEENEEVEYPKTRCLDYLVVKVQRQGEVQDVCFTDLCQDEQIRGLDNMNESELRGLCLKLAEHLRFIGDLFEMTRDENNQYSFVGRVRETTGG